MTLTKDVLKVGPFQQFIPDAVRVGDVVHVSGAVSTDEQGAPQHPGDLFAQMRQAYANIEAVLGHYDLDLSHLVKETVFVTDMAAIMGSEEGMQRFLETRQDVFGGYPGVAQSLIQVSGLVMPDLMVEIEAVAHG